MARGQAVGAAVAVSDTQGACAPAAREVIRTGRAWRAAGAALLLAATAHTPAAQAGEAPLARVLVTSPDFAPADLVASGPAFALPVSAARSASGTSPPPPADPTETFAVGASATVDLGTNRLPRLRVAASGSVATLEVAGTGSSASAIFEDLVTIDLASGLPVAGLLTLGLSLSATAVVGPVGIPGHAAEARFDLLFSASGQQAAILLLSEIGGNAGPLGRSRRLLQGLVPGAGTGDGTVDEVAGAANAFALDGLAFAVEVPFVSGQPIAFRLSATCAVFAIQRFDPGIGQGLTEAVCNAGNSLGLRGILAVTDPRGRPLPVVRIAAASGLAYDARPAPPAVIPEPASWAMLVLGFGLAGAALRRSAAVG